MITSRRGFLTGLVGLVAAPAIVRASSLMPVKVVEPDWILPNYGSNLWAHVRNDKPIGRWITCTEISDMIIATYKIDTDLITFGDAARAA